MDRLAVGDPEGAGMAWPDPPYAWRRGDVMSGMGDSRVKTRCGAFGLRHSRSGDFDAVLKWFEWVRKPHIERWQDRNRRNPGDVHLYVMIHMVLRRESLLPLTQTTCMEMHLMVPEEMAAGLQAMDAECEGRLAAMVSEENPLIGDPLGADPDHARRRAAPA